MENKRCDEVPLTFLLLPFKILILHASALCKKVGFYVTSFKSKMYMKQKFLNNNSYNMSEFNQNL